jgi:hypothetical protein
LRAFLVVLFDQRQQNGIVHPGGSDQWRVCFQDDATLLAPLDYIVSGKERMKFDLVDREDPRLAFGLLLYVWSALVLWDTDLLRDTFCHCSSSSRCWTP